MITPKQPIRRSEGNSALLYSLLCRIGNWFGGSRRHARTGDQWRLPLSTLHCEALETRLLLSADLAAVNLVHDAQGPVVAGDSAHFQVFRSGDEVTGQPIRIDLYASVDGRLDSADKLVGKRDLAPGRLARGVNTIDIPIDSGAISRSGSYALIGVIDPGNRVVESNEGNNQAVAGRPLVVRCAVGQLPGGQRLPALEFTDSDGTRCMLTISGKGVAELVADGNAYRLNISGGDGLTRVELTGRGGDGRVTLTAINVDSAAASVLAPVARLVGTARFSTLGKLVLADIPAGADLIGSAITGLCVSGDALGNLRLSGQGARGFVLGQAQIGGALGGLWAIGGRANSIEAQTTRADWRANFSGALQRLVVGGNASGQLACADLQFLLVGGNLQGMTLRVGADLGSDAALGGNGSAADAFRSGNLAHLRIGGNVVDSRILISVDPRNGQEFDGNDRQLGSTAQRIQEFLVGGQFKGDSVVVAPGFPYRVRIDDVWRDASTVGQFFNIPPDRTAPLLMAGLLTDSGVSASDRITNDPTIEGFARDVGGVRRLLATFDPLRQPLVDLGAPLSADGRFILSREMLDRLAGGKLADGARNLRLIAEDAAGNRSAAVDVAFTLDTSAPTAPALTLSLSSDTGLRGDRITEAARVTLVGSGEAGARLQLGNSGGGRLGIVGPGGRFFVPDVTLALGDNTFTLQLTDTAGNRRQNSVVLHRITRSSSEQDVVLQWNGLALQAIRLDATPPPVASRGLAMLSIAVFETVSAFDGTPGFYTTRSAPPGASLEAAVAATAQRLLGALHPGRQAIFDAALAATLAKIPDGTARTTAVAFGRTIADEILMRRSDDGSNAVVNFTGATAPGQWQPTPPGYAAALLPQWAELRPFAMSSPDAFRPVPPPALDSATYTADFNEVKALGAAIGSTRTADQTAIAQFWADGAGTETPPGHWNRIASAIADAQGNSIAANARLFAQLNVALADAAIAAWEAKYHYTAWRPVTAIRAADTDGNAGTTADTLWTPLLVTPPFPEYVSGHSTFSGAAEVVLSGIFGANTSFVTDSLSLPGVQRSFASFRAAAEEAGRSRIYGGIHFEYGNQAGLSTGRALGNVVLGAFTRAAEMVA